MFAIGLSLAIPASAEWKEKVLYSFRGGANDGSVPAGGVVFDPKCAESGLGCYCGFVA
jgi:hypothetical protein